MKYKEISSLFLIGIIGTVTIGGNFFTRYIARFEPTLWFPKMLLSSDW
jgi:hypothetical protein